MNSGSVYGRGLGADDPEAGVANGHCRPGFTNALTPIAHARLSNSPLLLIAGAVGLQACEKLDLQTWSSFR